jgi:hypothetical protein
VGRTSIGFVKFGKDKEKLDLRMRKLQIRNLKGSQRPSGYSLKMIFDTSTRYLICP